MFRLVLITFVLFVNFSFSQLAVRNDNYLFAKDVVLYVEDDIHLGETNSHVYLREESQLIQGSGSTGNSGIGKLSVHQNGTVNAYAYNYWCSPVGNVDASNNSNRNFIPSKSIYYETSAPINSSLASYVSSTYEGSSSPLVIASYWLWSYNPGTAYSEWDFVGANGNVSPGYGFSMKGNPSENQLYDFRGKPNNGTIQTSVLNGEETLVGNPYPSAIDAVSYIHDTTNTTLLDNATLMFWEQAPGANSHYLANYVGGYASYTISSDGLLESFTKATFNTYNGDGTLNTVGLASSSSKLVRRYIPIGQGFMIKGKASGSVRTTNAMRVFEKESGGNSEFFKDGGDKFETRTSVTNTTNSNQTSYNEEGLFIVPDGYKRFRVNIDFNETYTRQLMQNFHYSATDGDDYGLETIMPDVLNSDAYWPQSNKEFNAQAFSFDLGLKIPLVVKTAHNQLVRFRIFDIQNFDESQPIYIHDLQNNLYVDLRTQNYEITLDAGNYNNRFEITFEQEELLTNPELDINNTVSVFQNNTNSQLTIINPKGLDIENVTLIDLTGKLIFSKKETQVKEKLIYSTANLSSAVYLVKMTLTDQTSLSKKIIVKN